MRKFITKLSLFLLPYLTFYSIIIIINYKIDAYCVFSRVQVLERITDHLLSGKIIAGQPAFQFRPFQKLIIKKMKKIPNTIALGSSRTIQLRTSYLGLNQGSFFNHSVPIAVLNDFIAILGCYKREGSFPKTIIIGVDPDIFGKGFGINRRWRPIAFEYYYLLNYIKGDISKLKLFYELIKFKVSKMKSLLLYRRAIANYKYFNKVRKKGFDYKVVKNTSVDDWLIAPDGSLYFPFSVKFRDDSITKKKCQSVLNNRIRKYGQISPYFKETFISLIDYLSNNGAQIVFFLSPYHPLVYQEIKKKRGPHFVIKIEEMVRSLAQQRKIPVFGSYDPSRFGFSSRDFFDGSHVHDYAVKEIFKEYRQIVG